MNIQTDYSYNYNISMHGKGAPKNNRFWARLKAKIEQKFLDILPERDLKSDKFERKKKIDSFITRPDINRIIMGATAIVLQPTIDYYNHRVDEETRTVSRNRTIAKIIAGTAVGALVRWSSFKVVEKTTNLEGLKKHSKWLIPKDYLNKFTEKTLKNYRNAVSTGLALCVMVITNFVLDAPLTAILTNRLNAKSEQKRLAKEKEVSNG